MIRKALLELIHEAASIKRWNDHITPHSGFTELDKQAHKMMFAYVLARMEESDNQAAIDWIGLIEGAIFDFIHRVKLTDIKPPIYHQLMASKGEEVNRWVVSQVENTISGIGPGDYFLNNFQRHLFDPQYCTFEKKILKAAHYLATHWEFEIIYQLNSTLYGLEETRRNIVDEIEEHFFLAGVQKIWMRKKTHAFLDLVGQLRFQRRWAQTPRIPETSVMGHTLVVAMLSYLCSLDLNCCNKRLYNNFFGGLFHDLPEVLTRDIISPVKRSVTGLDDIIKEIETRQVHERLFPLLPHSWHPEILYFIENEFQSRVQIPGEGLRIVSSEDINNMYNQNQYNPVDGELIEACDKLSAYLEAALSINHGIQSPQLLDGYRSMYDDYKNHRVAGIDFGPLFDYFWHNR